MKCYLLAGIMACFYCSGFSQTLSTDTTLARQYYTLGDSLQQPNSTTVPSITEKIQADNSFNLSYYYNNLGDVYTAISMYDSAFCCHRKSVNLRLKFLGVHHAGSMMQRDASS
jgi:hypothetical protein